MASTARPRPKAAITCSKNSQPIVGMVRYPVRYRSRWIAPVAISRPAPATRSTALSQPGADGPACFFAARAAPVIVPGMVVVSRGVIVSVRSVVLIYPALPGPAVSLRWGDAGGPP